MKCRKINFHTLFIILTSSLGVVYCSSGPSGFARYGRQCSNTERPFELHIDEMDSTSSLRLITLKSDNKAEGDLLERLPGTYVFNGATIHYVNDQGDETVENDMHIIISQQKKREYQKPTVWASRVKCIRNGKSLIENFKSGKSIPITGLTRWHQSYEVNGKVSDIKYDKYHIVFRELPDLERKVFFIDSSNNLKGDGRQEGLKAVYESDLVQEVVFYEFSSEDGNRDETSKVSYQIRSKYQLTPSETVYLAVNLVRCVDPSQTDNWGDLTTEEKESHVKSYKYCLRELKVKKGR